MWKSAVNIALAASAIGIGYAWGASRVSPSEIGPEPAGVSRATELQRANARLQSEVRSCRKTVGRLLRERAAASRPAPLPPAAGGGNDAPPSPPPLEQDEAPEPQDAPILLRREYLDESLESVAIDPEWQAEVSAAVAQVFSAWPGAETISAQCSKALCRIDFTTGAKGNNLEAIMDQLNAIPEVRGERLIQVDDSVDPPIATAYFGRDGAISLATP
jgi:hypothetical protein